MLAAALPATPAWAQSGAGELLNQVRQANQPLQPPTAAPRVLQAPVRPVVDMPEGVTVAVTAFRISGASSYPPELLAGLVQPWVGKTLDLKGLNEAAGVITRHYQSAGHVLSYAYLPAQRVDGGTIEIAVLEGRLEAVQVVTAQDVRLRDEVVQAHTDVLTQAQPVLQADVERRLLLLNDVPGVVARAAFTPGASTGGAEVVVTVAEDEPLTLRLELDNHGSVSSGEWRAGVGLQLRDLFGWGDSTQLNALMSQDTGLVSGSIASQLPVGGNGLKLGASLSRLTYFLAPPFSALGAPGVANTRGVDACSPARPRPDANLWLRAGYERAQLNDQRIEIIGQSNRKLDQVLSLTINGDLRDGLFGGGASVATAVASFGNLDLLDSSAPNARYSKATLQLARQQTLFGRFSAYGRVLAQGSDDNLDSSQKLGLAGPGGVRAYAPGEASVDLGRLWSLELRYGLEQLGGNLVVSLFHDEGSGLVSRHPGTPDPNNEVHLRANGLGLQWTGGGYGVSATLAWRGSPAPKAGADDPRPRLYLQLFATP
jgi:hemolysin activation/secretion protein